MPQTLTRQINVYLEEHKDTCISVLYCCNYEGQIYQVQYIMVVIILASISK